jgi:glycosyltransferase involved in cell wall biosynthesis
MNVKPFQHKFTVFTPTYNRAHTLSRLHASLLEQTFKDFEWLIIDDGSTDNTRSFIKDLSLKSPISIRYFSQKNQHKKSAINYGVREANGELFLIIDSDDELLADSLQIFNRIWSSIPESRREFFSGATGLCINVEHKLIGERFVSDPLDSDALELYHRYSVRGEKCGFQTTDVMRKFPFREDITGLAPEALVWFDIARAGYKTRYFNEPVRLYHTTAESITHTPSAAIIDADGRALFARDQLQHDFLKWCWENPKDMLKEAAYYTRFHMHLRDSQPGKIWPLTSVAARAAVVAMAPFGWAFYWRDKYSACRS